MNWFSIPIIVNKPNKSILRIKMKRKKHRNTRVENIGEVFPKFLIGDTWKIPKFDAFGFYLNNNINKFFFKIYLEGSSFNPHGPPCLFLSKMNSLQILRWSAYSRNSHPIDSKSRWGNDLYAKNASLQFWEKYWSNCNRISDLKTIDAHRRETEGVNKVSSNYFFN